MKGRKSHEVLEWGRTCSSHDVWSCATVDNWQHLYVGGRGSRMLSLFTLCDRLLLWLMRNSEFPPCFWSLTVYWGTSSMLDAGAALPVELSNETWITEKAQSNLRSEIFALLIFIILFYSEGFNFERERLWISLIDFNDSNIQESRWETITEPLMDQTG